MLKLAKLCFLALTFLGTATTLLLAQNTDETTNPNGMCWIGSLRFTQGATARAADGVMICAAEGAWAEYKGGSAFCIRDGEVFSVGSVEAVRSNDDTTLKCLPDGTWEERRTE